MKHHQHVGLAASRPPSPARAHTHHFAKQLSPRVGEGGGEGSAQDTARATTPLRIRIPTRNPSHPAFTLVELLVVIGIIALLIAILLPSLSTAREGAKTLACLSNLRQLATAAQSYANANKGYFPIAQYTDVQLPLVYAHAWDFTTVRDTSTGVTTVQAGILWQGGNAQAVQQCPSYDGRSNSAADPYTGYNYNTSFIGHGQGETNPTPMKASQIRRPSQIALFGDGQYAAGANKYMRAPFPNPGDASFTNRAAGTQGYRHRKKTNVAFADAHAETWPERHTNTTPSELPKLTPNTGFLSEDNSLYDPSS